MARPGTFLDSIPLLPAQCRALITVLLLCQAGFHAAPHNHPLRRAGHMLIPIKVLQLMGIVSLRLAVSIWADKVSGGCRIGPAADLGGHVP